MSLSARYTPVVAALVGVLAGVGSVYAAKALPANSVGTSQLRNAAVTDLKLHNKSVTSSKIVDGSVTLADLRGTDVTGNISLSIGANTCINGTILVSGAQVGDVVAFSWEGNSNPATLMTGPARVASLDHVNVAMCNVSGTTLSLTSQSIRVVTFD